MTDLYVGMESSPDDGLVLFHQYLQSDPARWEDWKWAVRKALHPAPRSHALHRNVRRASTFESWSVTTSICLRSARSMPMIAFVIGTA
ncbi:hypothetical protein [Terrabacter sp. Root181]|uniref:hypothetical protein n=1 Tax=Terrabacter sp. Root181 TaxID=1736484 RepID=UPI0006F795C8|nr:hypothetical protein [Terrabacter sp. Root181]KRB46295.1 hypothetical protein ASD90_11405 [Terrabacter sp. Root181]KRF46635.1 hypothetical protein ASG96_00930 [Terrabacter sp. Soil810]